MVDLWTAWRDRKLYSTCVRLACIILISSGFGRSHRLDPQRIISSEVPPKFGPGDTTYRVKRQYLAIQSSYTRPADSVARTPVAASSLPMAGM